MPEILMITTSSNKTGFQTVLGKPEETFATGGKQELANMIMIERIAATIDAAFPANIKLAAHFSSSPAASGGSTLDLKIFAKDCFGHHPRCAINDAQTPGQVERASSRTSGEGFEPMLNCEINNADRSGPLLDQNYGS